MPSDPARPARDRGVDARRFGSHQLRRALARAWLGLDLLQLETQLGRHSLGEVGKGGVDPRRHARPDGDEHDPHAARRAGSEAPGEAWRAAGLSVARPRS
jgi:hypothetical protein